MLLTQEDKQTTPTSLHATNLPKIYLPDRRLLHQSRGERTHLPSCLLARLIVLLLYRLLVYFVVIVLYTRLSGGLLLLLPLLENDKINLQLKKNSPNKNLNHLPPSHGHS